MLAIADQRAAQRGNPKELTEVDVFAALEDVLPENLRKELTTIMDAIFVEERSVSIKQFHATVLEQAQFKEA